MASAVLSIKILTDASGAKKGMDAAASSMDKFKTGLRKAAVPAALVGAALVKFGTDAVNSASRTQQAMGGVEAVFGKNARTVERWAAAAASSIGLAKSEYGELATVIGSQLKNAGLPLNTVTKETGKLISKGADLAAMFGGTTADAVDALSSAMKGEFDPLEKYGASLSAAKIAAQMAAEGTDKLTGKQAAQAKTLATLHLIQKQTADSAGAAAREQDTYAARTQQFSAEVENLKSDLGTALLPIVAAVVDKFAGLAKWMSKNIGLIQVIVGVLATLVAIILVLNAAMKVAAIVQWAMNAAWLANPVTLIVLAIVALIAVVVVLYKKFPAVQRFFDTAFAGMKATVAIFVKAFRTQWNVISTVVRAVMGAIRTVVGNVVGWIVARWRAAWSTLRDVTGTLTAKVRAVKEAITAAIRNLVDWIVTKWRAAWSTLKTVTGTLTDKVRAVKDAIVAVFTNMKETVETKWANLWTNLKEKVGATLGKTLSKPFDAMAAAVGAVSHAIDTLIGWLSKIKIPSGVKGLMSKVTGHAVVPGGAAAGGAQAVAPRPTAAGRAAAAAPGAAGTTINIYGALDPEGVARQVGRILTGHERRIGAQVA